MSKLVTVSKGLPCKTSSGVKIPPFCGHYKTRVKQNIHNILTEIFMEAHKPDRGRDRGEVKWCGAENGNGGGGALLAEQPGILTVCYLRAHCYIIV